jgi:hypothetical protein
MTAQEVEQAHQKAAAFINRTVTLRLGQSAAAPGWTFIPVDGANNKPLAPDSAEIHLVADAKVAVPADAASLEIMLDRSSAAALTLLGTVYGKAERRPQVLFPGETSRPLKWQVTAPPATGQTFSWYEAPFQHGLYHPFLRESLQHWLLALILALSARTLARALLGWLIFHVVHTLTTYGCAVQNIVWIQPDWLWPVSLLAAVALAWRSPILAVPALAGLALLHSLDEWPHAALPSVIGMMELGLAAAHLAQLLPVWCLVALIRRIWAQKRTAC